MTLSAPGSTQEQHLRSKLLDYAMRDGYLYHIWYPKGSGHKLDCCVKQLVVPRTLGHDVLYSMHEDLTGHFGIARTLATVRSRYYWEGMVQDVEEWVKAYTLCDTRKSPRKAMNAPLIPIPGDKLAVDTIGLPLTTGMGNRYIVVFIDYLTK